MWRARTLTDLYQWTQARVVAKLVIKSSDLRVVDIGDYVELSGAGFETFYRRMHCVGHDTSGFPHIRELCFGFHQSCPVDQFVIVRNDSVWQPADDVMMRSRRVVMRIQFNPDTRMVPASGFHYLTEFVERMFFRVVHKMLRKANNVLRRKIGG